MFESTIIKKHFRIFDKDKDGFLTVAELRKIMSSMGEKMSRNELDAMLREADSGNDGLISCQGKIVFIYFPFFLIFQNDVQFCALMVLSRKRGRRSRKKAREG